MWQLKIIKYANNSAAGMKLSPPISHLFDLTKKNVATVMYVGIYTFMCIQYTFMSRYDGSSGSLSISYNCRQETCTQKW